jgi:uncharacterized membrane protein
MVNPMDWKRLFRHAFARRGQLRDAFPAATLEAIERAIAESETTHGAEIRFAIEAALEPGEVWAGKTPRQRALEVFSSLGVWDTEANNGVLIYLLLADRDVEIVADRGYNGKVSAAEWSTVCETMERDLRAGCSPGTYRQCPMVATRTSCRTGPPCSETVAGSPHAAME